MNQLSAELDCALWAGPEITLPSVRITPECLERWQRESRGGVRQQHDGSLRSGVGVVYIHEFDDGRLGVSCALSESVAIFLFAEPHEWSLV